MNFLNVNINFYIKKPYYINNKVFYYSKIELNKQLKLFIFCFADINSKKINY